MSIGESNSTSFPDDAGHYNLGETAKTEKGKSEISQKEISLPDRREEDNIIDLYQQVSSDSASQKKKKKKASKGTGSSAQTVSSKCQNKEEGSSLTATPSEGICKALACFL